MNSPVHHKESAHKDTKKKGNAKSFFYRAIIKKQEKKKKAERKKTDLIGETAESCKSPSCREQRRIGGRPAAAPKFNQ